MMNTPTGLILTKYNMKEIEYILNSILEKQYLDIKENHTCYICFNTKSYESKFKCDKIKIFMFNDLYRFTFLKQDYGNSKTADYECFTICERYGGIFKFSISFSGGWNCSTNTTDFQIHLDQFFLKI